MAKKKKITRRDHKKSSALYKKFLLGCVGLAAFLAVYCYYTARSGDVPVISGPDYPKRTPGKTSNRIQYAVYDQLAASQKSKTAVLLPPEEVPSQLPVWSGDKFPDPSQPTPPTNLTTSDLKPSERAIVPSVQSSDKISDKSESLISKKSEITPEFSQPGATMKTPRGLAGQKDGRKKAPISIPKESNFEKKQSTQMPKAIVRMQIGSIYRRADQAQGLIQKIARKGGFPKGMRPVVQKATLQGSPAYRVVLMGQCSVKILAAYQNWLKKQKL
jgi:hypothetical protein